MLIWEYRIVLPMTVAEYQVGQLYNLAQICKESQGDNEGIEIIKNEPFIGKPLFGDQYSSGQYTYKIYRQASKIPWWVRSLLPARLKVCHEEAWNAYPYCLTILKNPMLEHRFNITIESIHLEDAGDAENAHCLSPDMLAKRQVIHIDIGNDRESKSEFSTDADPSQFKSEKTKRGPLKANWKRTSRPIMTCYKLVKVDIPIIWGHPIESYVISAQRRLFLKFNQRVFCTIDQWHQLTLEDVRNLENEVEAELQRKLTKSSVIPLGPSTSQQSNR